MMARISVSWLRGSGVAAGFISIEVLCDAKLKKSFDTFAAHFLFLFPMSESTSGGSTWHRAFLLWLYTNVGGFIGTSISLHLLVALDHNNRSTGSDTGLIMLLVGLFAAVPSLLLVPLIYAAFRWLLRIANYWPRLLAAAAVITGLFLLVALAASKSAGDNFSLTGIVYMGGWAYWATALGAAALLYQQELFRPDASAETRIN